MAYKTKIVLAVICGVLLGATGQVMASKLSQPPPSAPPTVQDPMQQAWQEFDRSMNEEQQAMRKLFSTPFAHMDAAWPSPTDAAGTVQADQSQMVIKVPIQDPHHKIQVSLNNGFLTVHEQADSKTKNATSMYNSVQSFSVSSEYDASKMTQKFDGNTLIISIPRSTSMQTADAI